jgi:phosphinothricin acetyltransferase
MTRRRAEKTDGRIRGAATGDAERLCAIYNYYVANTVITFEEQAVPAPEMGRRIADGTTSYPWLVWEHDGTIAGYAYAAAWRPRSAYRFAVETTVYISPERAGQGIGAALYEELIERVPACGFHCAIGSIALPNPASVALHEKFGFTKLGELKEIGWKLDRWVDVGYWQLLL